MAASVRASLVHPDNCIDFMNHCGVNSCDFYSTLGKVLLSSNSGPAFGPIHYQHRKCNRNRFSDLAYNRESFALKMYSIGSIPVKRSADVSDEPRLKVTKKGLTALAGVRFAPEILSRLDELLAKYVEESPRRKIPRISTCC